MNNRHVLFAVSVPVILFMFFSCGKKKTETEESGTSPLEKTIVAVSGLEHLTTIVEEAPGKLLVFDLYADWCYPCKLLSPVFSQLAADHAKNARFFRIDVGRHKDIAAAFRVRGIPLVVFIKDKQVVHSLTGINPRETYERVLTACGPSVSVADCKARLRDAL